MSTGATLTIGAVTLVYGVICGVIGFMAGWAEHRNREHRAEIEEFRRCNNIGSTIPDNQIVPEMMRHIREGWLP